MRRARGPFKSDDDLLNAVFYPDEILRPLFAARDEADYTRFYTGYNPLKELLTHVARQRHIGYIALRGENLNVEMTQ